MLFDRFVTIRNGVITEDINPDSIIYELFTICLASGQWTILCNNHGYSVVMVSGRTGCIYPSGILLNRVKLGLTTRDKEKLDKCRDSCLVS